MVIIIYMCIHTVCIRIEGCWTRIQSVPPEPYLDLENPRYKVLVNTCLACGTYGHISRCNLLRLTADEVTAGLTSIHLPLQCSLDACLDISPKLASNLITGGKIQTFIVHSYVFNFLHSSALVSFVFGELGNPRGAVCELWTGHMSEWLNSEVVSDGVLVTLSSCSGWVILFRYFQAVWCL